MSGVPETLEALYRHHRATMEAIDRQLAEAERKGKGITTAEHHLRDLREAEDEAQRRGDRDRAAEIEELKREVVKKIAARRDERSDARDRITELEKREAIQQHKIEQAKGGARLGSVTCFDGCAVPRGCQLLLLWARGHGSWSGRLNSGDRTAANCDHCSDKSSQPELWAAAQNGTGNPANPPCSYCSTCGGTHERQNDGTAYPSEPRGANGPWWWQGMDLTEAQELINALGAKGIRLRLPYSNESWHANIVEDPEPAMRRAGIL